MNRLLWIALLFAAGSAARGQDTAEILRDRYGVPHVYASSRAAAYYGAGWAHAEDEAPTLARQILAAEGRLAEFFGQPQLESDLAARALGSRRAAERDWSKLSGPVREVLSAFAAGYSDFLAARPDRWKAYPYVLPITGWQLAAMLLHGNAQDVIQNMSPEETSDLGSNSAAIADSKTTLGVSMLYGDPHVIWGGANRTVHLEAPGLSLYGSFNGPIMGGGRANGLVYGGTHNTPDGGDVWELALDPNDPMRYRRDGVWQRFVEVWEDFEVGHATVRERILYTRPMPSGERRWVFHREGDSALAIGISVAARIEYVDAKLQSQWATSVADFHDLASSTEPLKGQNCIVLADTAGRIAYYYYGRVPVRLPGLDTRRILDGTTSSTEWSGLVYGIGAAPTMPFTVDPPAGWVQGSNDAPWYATEGEGNPPGREAWPHEIVGRNLDATGRGLRLRQLLSSDVSIDEAELKAIAFDTLSWDAFHFVQAIERGWKVHGRNLPSPGPDAATLDSILRAWDAKSSLDSTGMTAMVHFRRVARLGWFAPGETPDLDDMLTYLDDLAATAVAMRDFYGDRFADPLRVAWGDVHYIVRGGVRFPLSGGTKAISALRMAHMRTAEGGGDAMTRHGEIVCFAGSGYTHGHVLDPGAPRSWFVTPLGQIDPAYYPGSPHVNDQTAIFARDDWTPMYLDRADVEAHPCPGGDGHEHPYRTLLSR